MELAVNDVKEILFGEPTKAPNLEAVIMLHGSLDVVLTIDEIASLPDASDRKIALQMMLEQIKVKGL